MPKKLAFILSLSFILFYSCGKYPCQQSIGLRLAFVSFTEEEIDTILLKRFVKGTDFNQAIDTTLVDTSLITYGSRGDTLFPVQLHASVLLPSFYDYQVVIPAASKTYAIKDIKEEEKKMHSGLFSNTKELCFNPITAYTLNNVIKTVEPNHEVVYLDY